MSVKGDVTTTWALDYDAYKRGVDRVMSHSETAARRVDATFSRVGNTSSGGGFAAIDRQGRDLVKTVNRLGKTSLTFFALQAAYKAMGMAQEDFVEAYPLLAQNVSHAEKQMKSLAVTMGADVNTSFANNQRLIGATSELFEKLYVKATNAGMATVRFFRYGAVDAMEVLDEPAAVKGEMASAKSFMATRELNRIQLRTRAVVEESLGNSVEADRLREQIQYEEELEQLAARRLGSVRERELRGYIETQHAARLAKIEKDAAKDRRERGQKRADDNATFAAENAAADRALEVQRLRTLGLEREAEIAQSVLEIEQEIARVTADRTIAPEDKRNRIFLLNNRSERTALIASQTFDREKMAERDRDEKERRKRVDEFTSEFRFNIDAARIDRLRMEGKEKEADLDQIRLDTAKQIAEINANDALTQEDRTKAITELNRQMGYTLNARERQSQRERNKAQSDYSARELSSGFGGGRDLQYGVFGSGTGSLNSVVDVAKQQVKVLMQIEKNTAPSRRGVVAIAG